MSGEKKSEKSSVKQRSLSESKSKKGETISKDQWGKLRKGGTPNEEYIYYR